MYACAASVGSGRDSQHTGQQAQAPSLERYDYSLIPLFILIILFLFSRDTIQMLCNIIECGLCGLCGVTMESVAPRTIHIACIVHLISSHISYDTKYQVCNEYETGTRNQRRQLYRLLHLLSSYWDSQGQTRKNEDMFDTEKKKMFCFYKEIANLISPISSNRRDWNCWKSPSLVPIILGIKCRSFLFVCLHCRFYPMSTKPVVETF